MIGRDAITHLARGFPTAAAIPRGATSVGPGANTLGEHQAAVIENLGAPVLQVWDGVVAVPLVGLLDNNRAGVVTDALLSRVAQGSTSTEILDLTGVDMIASSAANA